MQSENEATEAPPAVDRALGGKIHELGAAFHQMASLAAHALFLTVAALAPPSFGASPADTYREDAIHAIQQALAAHAEPDQEVRPDPTAEPEADGRERARSKCGERYGGSSGDLESAEARRRYGVQGPADNPDPHLARQLRRNAEWVFSPSYSIYPTSWGADPDAPRVPYGRDDSLGNDRASARANMWGEEIGMALGSPGVGIGSQRRCRNCGDYGLGIHVEGSARAGWTGTESTSMWRAARADTARHEEPNTVGIVSRKPPF